MIILAIESSCDDSAVCIMRYNSKIKSRDNINEFKLQDNINKFISRENINEFINKKDEYEVLSHQMYSQIVEHTEFQGIVPSLASTLHTNKLKYLISLALKEANIELDQVDCIAATGGPGLIGSLIIGTTYAKALASILNKPYIAINHLEGHALSPMIGSNLQFPYLLLLISGGHSQFFMIKNFADYKLLGFTMDDSVGECFDKVARLLGLSFPGGPAIEAISVTGDSSKFEFPLAVENKAEYGCNMSFSGIKTFALNLVKKISPDELKENVPSLAASFQECIAKNLVYKTSIAMSQYKKEINLKNLNSQALNTQNSDTQGSDVQDSSAQGSDVQDLGRQGSSAQGSDVQDSSKQGSDVQDLGRQGSSAQGSDVQDSSKQGSDVQDSGTPLNFVIAGGVASNKYIYNALSNLAKKNNFNIFAPAKELCTDNAVMIAFTALQYYKNNLVSSLNFSPKSKWPLQEKNLV